MSSITISIQLTVCSSLAALAIGVVAQSRRSDPANDNLQEQYNSAERFQQSGDLVQAARQYRVFLAGAQGELAAAHAASGDYRGAATLFSDALSIQPNSPELQLGYARTALLMGDLPQTEKLARAFLADDNRDPRKIAQGHQILGRALLKMNRDQEARAEMQQAVNLDPSFANRYGLAVVCLDLDDEECATQNFHEVEHSFGDTPALHMQFGLAYGNSDFTPQAIAEFRKVIAESPSYPQAHYSLAAALLAAGDDQKNVPEAEAELKKELAISPHDFLTYSALGKLAVSKHQYAEADAYLKRATLLNRGNPDAYLYLGQMYFETNRPAEAESALRKAIKLTSDPSRNRYQIQKAYFLLGRVLMQEHRPDEAHAEMELAKSYANKGLSHDKGQLAGLLNNSELAGASDNSNNSAATFGSDPSHIDSGAMNHVRAIDKQLAPAIADSYNNLGVISAANSNYADAFENFRRAAVWNPELNGLDLNLGRAAFMISNFADAVPPLSRYIRSHPGDSGLRGALAMSEFMTHNYRGCLAALTKAGGEVTAIPQMQYIYAESLAKTGQVASARERLERLESAHPEIAEVHRGLGEIAEQQGDLQKALKELNTANQLNASDPETHFDLGETQLEKGRTAGAILELQTAVRLMPEDARYHQELASAYERAFRMSDAVKERKIADQIHADKPPIAKIGRSDVEKNPEQ